MVLSPNVSMPHFDGATPQAGPLIVRLRNWVGDVVLSVPALRLLQACGHTLHLVGKPWAASLLAGEGWPVHTLAPRGLRQGARQLRALRQQCQAADPGFGARLNMLVMPYSFSSAAHARLAGLRAVGHAYDGRSPLLARAVPVPRGVHELQSLWQLAWAVVGTGPPPPVPQAIGLRIAPAAQDAALRSLAVAGVRGRYMVLCPFAAGSNDGRDKRWPGFATFAAQAARQWELPLVLCPGPGEEAAAQALHPGAIVLPGLPLGSYAAVLQRAALMVANDTGPGHLAAAVGAPVITVMRNGPASDKIAKWRPWGAQAQVLHAGDDWPAVPAVLALAGQLLAAAQ
jgi:heptosyltransferase II